MINVTRSKDIYIQYFCLVWSVSIRHMKKPCDMFQTLYQIVDWNTLYTVVHCIKFIINYWNEI